MTDNHADLRLRCEAARRRLVRRAVDHGWTPARLHTLARLIALLAAIDEVRRRANRGARDWLTAILWRPTPCRDEWSGRLTRASTSATATTAPRSSTS